MPLDFTKCETCGKIFAKEGDHTECRSCRKDNAEERTDRDLLRDVRNYLRDIQMRGVLLTIEQLCEDTDCPPEQIWQFIHNGDLDLARFDDPAVKSYLVQRRREQDKMLRERAHELKSDKPEKPEKSPSSGFHLSSDDRRGR